jgi:hypothetical protein
LLRFFFAAGGSVTTLAGSVGGYLDGVGTLARFNSPYGVSVHQSTGVVYVGDNSNHKVRAIAPGASHI